MFLISPVFDLLQDGCNLLVVKLLTSLRTGAGTGSRNGSWTGGSEPSGHGHVSQSWVCFSGSCLQALWTSITTTLATGIVHRPSTVSQSGRVKASPVFAEADEPPNGHAQTVD